MTNHAAPNLNTLRATAAVLAGLIIAALVVLLGAAGLNVLAGLFGGAL